MSYFIILYENIYWNIWIVHLNHEDYEWATSFDSVNRLYCNQYMKKWINTRDVIRESTTKREENLKNIWLFVLKTRPLALHRNLTILSLWLVWETHIIVLGKLQNVKGAFAFSFRQSILVPYFQSSSPFLNRSSCNLPLPLYRIAMCVCEYAYLAVWLGQTYFLVLLFIHLSFSRRKKTLLHWEFLFIII